MPQAVDDVWSAVGGGPADLTFPEAFLGHWLAESTLSAVETPLGPDFVPNPQVPLPHHFCAHFRSNSCPVFYSFEGGGAEKFGHIMLKPHVPLPHDFPCYDCA